MAGSLGELFISLGFDVDDAKLKTFKSNLRDTHEEAVKLGTTIATTTGILSAFVQHSANNAVSLNNMALMFGANTQAAQTFANALHQVNSLISISAGQSMFGQFSQMITGKIPMGQGAAGAISLLGGYSGADSFTGQSAEQVLERLAKHYDAMKKQLGSAYGVQLEAFGMGGAEGAIAELAHNPAAYHAMSKYNVSDENLGKLSHYASTVATLDDAYKKFADDMSAELAPKMEKAIHILIDALEYLDNFNTNHPGAATAEAIGASAAGVWTAKKILGSLFGGGAAAAGTDAAGVATGIGASGVAAVAGLASAPWVGSWAGTQIGNYLAGKGYGFSAAQRAGIMDRLQLESGMNPAALGDNGAAYGLAQWHKTGQDEFKSWSGHDIHGTSADEQMQFLYYQLMHGKEKSAGDALHKQTTEADSYRAFTKLMERPLGSDGIHITVNSTADAKTVAQEVKREIQGYINRTHAQTNLQSN